MKTHIFSALVFVTVCELAFAQEFDNGECSNAEAGYPCFAGEDVQGVCEYMEQCTGESDCRLVCQAKANVGPGGRPNIVEIIDPDNCDGKLEGAVCGEDDSKLCQRGHDCYDIDCRLLCTESK